jgi:L-fucose isomerase-like protein
MSELKLAFIPIARPTFDLDFARQKSEMARRHLLQEQGLALFGPDDLVSDASSVNEVVGELAAQPLDLLVLFQATFADSSMATTLAGAIDAPILLWAVPEPHTAGRLRLNSLCGINLAGHALTRQNRDYNYVFTHPEDTQALDDIKVHARAGRARRLLKAARLGRVGENPAGFETCLADPVALKERFGLDLVQFDLEEHIFPQVRERAPEQTQEVIDQLAQRVEGLDKLEPEATRATIGTYLALREIAERNQLQGFAVRCWPEFFTQLGCAACGAMSLLSDEMRACSCEADVNGTITQLALQWLSDQPAFGSDIVSIDEGKDAFVLWHCGLAPLSMADPQAIKRATIHSNRQLPLLMEFPLKPGRVTVARLSESSGDYRLVVGGGEMLRGPQSFSGTSGLLKFDRPARDVLDTIMAQGLEHHISITYGDYQDELLSLAKYLKLPLVHLN